MTRTTKVKTKKAKRLPGLEDPAIVAGKKAEVAKAAWLALPDRTTADEETQEYEAAEKRSSKAYDDFAAAPVTSLAGALIKMRALLQRPRGR